MGILYWIIDILLIVGAIALIGVVLMQKSNSGGSLGAAFGGASDNFFGKNKAKTSEAKMQRLTVWVGVLFAVASIALCLIIKLA